MAVTEFMQKILRFPGPSETKSEPVVCETKESLTSVGWQHVDVAIVELDAGRRWPVQFSRCTATSSKRLTFAAAQHEHSPHTCVWSYSAKQAQ